jgi:AraC-like DNA-binding protein
MNYSSVAHLSSQFKKVTGVTPSYYKGHKLNLRLPKKRPVTQQQTGTGETQGLIAA